MSDDTIWIPRRKPGPRPIECPTVSFSVRILGQAQLDTWQAMKALAGRRNHELAADILLEAIRAAQEDPAHQAMVRALKMSRAGLRVVPDVR